MDNATQNAEDAIYRLTVKQRDAAWAESERLRKSLDAIQAMAKAERDEWQRENQTLRGDISKLRTMLVAATQTPESALRAMDAALASPATERPNGDGWMTIDSAPRDGTLFLVWAPGRDGLPEMFSLCAWHPDAGFCIDELREPMFWKPLTRPAAAVVGQTEPKGDS